MAASQYDWSENTSRWRRAAYETARLWAVFRQRTLLDPVYNAAGRCTRQGGWGGTAAFLALASRWGIDIVCWDRRHLGSKSAVRIVRPEGAQFVPLDVVRVGDCCNAGCRTMLCAEHLYGVRGKGKRRRLIHVVYNGRDHYAAMVEAGWRRRSPHSTIADVNEP